MGQDFDAGIIGMLRVIPETNPEAPEAALHATLKKFLDEAKVTREQEQGIYRVLYDLRLSWTASGQELAGLDSDDAGETPFTQAMHLAEDESRQRLKKLLSPEQYDLWQQHIGGLLPILSNALTFGDARLNPLPLP